MARLDIERQLKVEPERMKFAKKEIEAKGYKVRRVSDTQIQFDYMGSTVNFFPYSGWASGRGITDGRGIKKLLLQI